MHPHNLYAIPREKSVERFRTQIRHLSRRKAPLKLGEVIDQLNPVIRGWGNYYRKARVRRLFNELDRWIERRTRFSRNGGEIRCGAVIRRDDLFETVWSD